MSKTRDHTKVSGTFSKHNDIGNIWFRYYAVGRLTTIWDGLGSYIAYNYDAGGRLQQKWLSNGAGRSGLPSRLREQPRGQRELRPRRPGPAHRQDQNGRTCTARLDPKVMVDAINAGSGRNRATEEEFPRSILPRTFDYGFATGLMYKDVKLCLEEAEALGARCGWRALYDSCG